MKKIVFLPLSLPLALLLIGFTIAPSFSHSGGTDSSGCHYNRRTGEYHCH